MAGEETGAKASVMMGDDDEGSSQIAGERKSLIGCLSIRLLEFIHVRIALIHQAAYILQTIRANKGACVAAYVRTEEQSLG